MCDIDNANVLPVTHERDKVAVMDQILETAIQTEGSVSKLAQALDVRQNVVSNWRARGLPKPWAQVLTLRYLKTRKTKAVANA